MSETDEEVDVSFDMTASERDTVQRAAALTGISFEDYVKTIVYDKAVADLLAAKADVPK